MVVVSYNYYTTEFRNNVGISITALIFQVSTIKKVI